MDQPIEQCTRPSTLDLQQQAVSADMTAWRNRMTFERHAMISSITLPQPRNGHGQVGLQGAIDYEWARTVEMLAESRTVFGAHCIAHVQRSHARMPEKDCFVIML